MPYSSAAWTRAAASSLPALLIATAAAPAEKRPLTLDLIFSPDAEVRIEFGGSPVTELAWLEDGKRFLMSRREGDIFRPPVVSDALAGGEEPLFDGAQLLELLAETAAFAEGDRELTRADVRWSPSHDALAFRHADDLFSYHWSSKRLARLTADEGREEVYDFSPDGEFVSFVADHDLHLASADGGTRRTLTDGGRPELLHGKLDWVYQEEIYGRGNFKGYWWSPDSSRIAYLEVDQSEVPEFTVLDHLPAHQAAEITRYPKAGDPNPRVRLGVVRAAGGDTIWVDTERYQDQNHLIVGVGWTPSSDRVVFMVQDREQTWLDVNVADPTTGLSRNLTRETSPAFVDVDLSGEPHWLADGSFLWLSGRTGFHHVYHFEANGTLRRQLTSGPWEVRDLYGADPENGWVYFAASKHRPTETHLYRVRLDGSELERLSQRPGTHTATFDPSFSFYLDAWSDIRTPPRVFLHRNTGEQIRIVDANEVAALDQYRLGTIEFMSLPAADGFQMEALWIKPSDFDPQRTYPVLTFIYGGPHAPVVRNRWGGARDMWHHLLTQMGYVVWMCDSRSASGKGIAPTWEAHRRLGEVELRDSEAGLDFLQRQTWVDSGRIGIWGWSYGGFMTAFALTHSDRFRVGIAGAPVTDWRLYDSIYTERYMGTPESNPDGYLATSVVEAAADLQGRLLLIHGTMDDNVHLQNTLQLAHALQKAGKSFELMLYPASRHGITDPELRFHLYSLMTRFLQDNL